MLVVALMGLGFFTCTVYEVRGRHVAQQKYLYCVQSTKYQSFFFQLKKKGVERAAVHAAMQPQPPKKHPKMKTKLRFFRCLQNGYFADTPTQNIRKINKTPIFFFQLKEKMKN